MGEAPWLNGAGEPGCVNAPRRPNAQISLSDQGREANFLVVLPAILRNILLTCRHDLVMVPPLYCPNLYGN
jgi:hypothetical protein